jgi:hypothetical protein
VRVHGSARYLLRVDVVVVASFVLAYREFSVGATSPVEL